MLKLKKQTTSFLAFGPEKSTNLLIDQSILSAMSVANVGDTSVFEVLAPSLALYELNDALDKAAQDVAAK